ncbi:MAG: hypothetical protein MUF00_02015 [Gemmatimonadaceae bacterium]|jgi:hypothetical protein|nr:hypothetical protein [Gemmatimonadaceae bacterium]
MSAEYFLAVGLLIAVAGMILWAVFAVAKLEHDTSGGSPRDRLLNAALVVTSSAALFFGAMSWPRATTACVALTVVVALVRYSGRRAR